MSPIRYRIANTNWNITSHITLIICVDTLHKKWRWTRFVFNIHFRSIYTEWLVWSLIVQFWIIGRPIYPESCRLLRCILHSLLSSNPRNHWHLLDLWLGKRSRWYWIYAEETTWILLEILLGHCNTFSARCNSYLHHRYTYSTDLQRRLLSW